ncbi:MAG: hypothetical protein ACPGR8_13485 [Limisphaerales bacterium]
MADPDGACTTAVVVQILNAWIQDADNRRDLTRALRARDQDELERRAGADADETDEVLYDNMLCNRYLDALTQPEIDRISSAVALGVPRRFAQTASKWLGNPGLPYLCYMDAVSQQQVTSPGTLAIFGYEGKVYRTIETLAREACTAATGLAESPSFSLACHFLRDYSSTTASAPSLVASTRGVPPAWLLQGTTAATKKHVKEGILARLQTPVTCAVFLDRLYNGETVVGDEEWGAANTFLAHQHQAQPKTERYTSLTVDAMMHARELAFGHRHNTLSRDVQTSLHTFMVNTCGTLDEFILFVFVVAGLFPLSVRFKLAGLPVGFDVLSLRKWKKAVPQWFPPPLANAKLPTATLANDLEVACADWDSARHIGAAHKRQIRVGIAVPSMRVRDYVASDNASAADCIAQRKYDGSRAQLHVFGVPGSPPSGIYTYSKNGRQLFSDPVDELAEQLREQLLAYVFVDGSCSNVILDGELVMFDENNEEVGLGSAMMHRQRVRGLRFVAFDAIMLLGNDVTSYSAERRLALLRKYTFSLPKRSAAGTVLFQVAPDYHESVPPSDKRSDFLARRRWEGIVFRDRSEPYIFGRVPANNMAAVRAKANAIVCYKLRRAYSGPCVVWQAVKDPTLWFRSDRQYDADNIYVEINVNSYDLTFYDTMQTEMRANASQLAALVRYQQDYGSAEDMYDVILAAPDSVEAWQYKLGNKPMHQEYVQITHTDTSSSAKLVSGVAVRGLADLDDIDIAPVGLHRKTFSLMGKTDSFVYDFWALPVAAVGGARTVVTLRLQKTVCARIAFEFDGVLLDAQGKQIESNVTKQDLCNGDVVIAPAGYRHPALPPARGPGVDVGGYARINATYVDNRGKTLSGALSVSAPLTFTLNTANGKYECEHTFTHPFIIAPVKR